MNAVKVEPQEPPMPTEKAKKHRPTIINVKPCKPRPPPSPPKQFRNPFKPLNKRPLQSPVLQQACKKVRFGEGNMDLSDDDDFVDMDRGMIMS